MDGHYSMPLAEVKFRFPAGHPYIPVHVLAKARDGGCISKIYAKLKNFGDFFIIADFPCLPVPYRSTG